MFTADTMDFGFQIWRANEEFIMAAFINPQQGIGTTE